MTAAVIFLVTAIIIGIAAVVERYLNPWTLRGRWRSIFPSDEQDS